MAPTWTCTEVVVDGAALACWRMVGAAEAGTGKGQGGVPVVLAHGFSDDGLCWLPLADELATRYDVVMPDARGHGRSARVERGAEIDAAADLAGVIRALGMAPAVVAGHSMGAMTASHLGARFPELTRALILEDPPWHPEMRARADGPLLREESPLARWIRSLADMPIDEIVAQERKEHPGWPEPVLRRWCEAKKALDPAFLTVEDTGRMSWQRVVGAIECPTLLITADPELGGIVTPELAHEAAAANPQIRVVHVPGVGHHVRFAAYDAYRDAVMAFLEDVA